MVAPSVIPGRAYQRVDRVSRLLFHFRADDLDWRKAVTGQLSNLVQTGRNSIATSDDRVGRIRDAVAHQLRLSMVDYDGDGIGERPGYLCEHPKFNLLPHSEQFDQYTDGGGCTVTADDLKGPRGAKQAEKLDFTTSTSTNFRSKTYTVADPENRTFVYSLWIHDGIGTGALTEAGNGFQVQIRRGDTSESSTYLVGDATLKLVKRYADGWSRWYAKKAFGSSTTGDDVQILVRSNAAIGHFYAFGGVLEEAQFPSSYVPTGAAAVQRVDEGLVYTADWTPKQHPTVTIYMAFARPIYADIAGASGNTAHGLFDLGDSGSNHLWAYINGTDKTLFFSGAGASSEFGGPDTPALPAGALQEYIMQLKNMTTAPQIAYDIGAGLSAFGTIGTVPVLAYANPRIRVAGITNASGRLDAPMHALKVGSGLLTRQQMREML